ncbi:MAG: nuclear transport factor 2 family protein [Sphingomonadaceae bacterium]
MTDDLASRLALMEDIEAIRRLKHHYCALCDENYNAPALAALFTEDGVWDAGEDYGRYAGRTAIENFFAGMPKAVSFSVHTALNDIIDVKGDVAEGRWRAIIPATLRIDGRETPYWLFSEYDDAFRKVDGEWRFTRLRSIIHRSSPHMAGWV